MLRYETIFYLLRVCRGRIERAGRQEMRRGSEAARHVGARSGRFLSGAARYKELELVSDMLSTGLTGLH